MKEKQNLKDVIISGIIMIIATVFMLLAAFVFSKYHIEEHKINIPGEIEKPQVQQELMEIKKVGE